MKTSELIHNLEILAPPSYAESWDNVGLLVGNSEREVHKIYLALDATGEAVETAIQAGCDMMITHHPLLFSAIKSIRDDNFIAHRLLRMIENKMNYYAMHTNYDAAVMADLVADKLHIINKKPLASAVETEDGVVGIGTIGNIEEMTLRNLAAYIKKEFNLPDVRYYGQSDAPVSKVAVCPGGGKSVVDGAFEEKCDVYITGDVDHHFGIDCVEQGLFVIDAGHHGLEYVFVDQMRDYLSQHFPELEIVTDKNHSPFQVV